MNRYEFCRRRKGAYRDFPRNKAFFRTSMQKTNRKEKEEKEDYESNGQDEEKDTWMEWRIN
jgi:hypothetical protein